MDLGDRIVWMLVGGVIGFVLGYVVRSLRDIKETVDHVDETISRTTGNGKTERGFARLPTFTEVGMAVVVALAFWSAIASQQATDGVRETQQRLQITTHCNKLYLSTLLKAVNQRTSTNEDAAESNVNLQQSWYNFVQFSLHVPPYPETDRRNKANAYAHSLRHFLRTSTQSRVKVLENPYPTDQDLSTCINNEETK